MRGARVDPAEDRLGTGEQAPLAIEALDHVVVTVRDLDRSGRFYERVLGMSIEPYGRDRLAARFGVQKVNLHQAGRLRPPVARIPTPGSADLCLLVRGPLDAVTVHLRSRGIPIVHGPIDRTGGAGPIRSVYLRDPDGNLIELSVRVDAPIDRVSGTAPENPSLSGHDPDPFPPPRDRPMTDDYRYPNGRFRPADSTPGSSDRRDLIDRIRDLPDRVREAVAGLDDDQLDTPYREDGWTPRQITHHIADSHMNAVARMKVGLTEDTPRIMTYEQDRWADLDDAKLPVEISLGILDGIHQRWVAVLEGVEDGEWDRTIDHPENGTVTLAWLLQLYAWHGDHHAAQIERLREERGW